MGPNFFLVGAHKSGTTALYAHLRQHPDIFLSPRKEPQYFVPEFRTEHLTEETRKRWRGRSQQRMGPIARWEDYLKLFRGAAPGQPVGEGSVGYLWSPTAARSIHARIPDARILMILRNPTDRAFSHYNGVPHTLRRQSFSDAIRTSASATSNGPLHVFNPFLGFGMYAAQVTRYLECFERDRVRIFLYEDFLANPEALLRGVFAFLGVRPDVQLDLSGRYNEARVPRFPALETSLAPLARSLRGLLPGPLRRATARARWRSRDSLRMSAGDRHFLVDYYATDVRVLQDIIGRDLSEWLDPGEP